MKPLCWNQTKRRIFNKKVSYACYAVVPSSPRGQQWMFSYLLFKPSQSESSFYHTETFSLWILEHSSCHGITLDFIDDICLLFGEDREKAIFECSKEWFLSLFPLGKKMSDARPGLFHPPIPTPMEIALLPISGTLTGPGGPLTSGYVSQGHWAYGLVKKMIWATKMPPSGREATDIRKWEPKKKVVVQQGESSRWSLSWSHTVRGPERARGRGGRTEQALRQRQRLVAADSWQDVWP